MKNIFTRMHLTIFLLVIQIAVFLFLLYRIFVYLPFITYIAYAISIVVALILIKKDKASAYKVSWIIIVLGVPILGGLLYLLVGDKRPLKKIAAHAEEHALIAKTLESDDMPDMSQSKDPRRADSFEYIRKISAYHTYENIHTTYYPMGEIMFEDMLTELSAAQKFIFLEFFIVKKSHMWDRICEILVEKAAQGVEVRVVVDDLGSFKLFTSAYVAALTAKNVKIIRFNPIIPFLSLFMNNRDHRKILVIDGHTAFNGGLNISDEYINLTSPFGLWKDTGVCLKGAAAWSFTLMFIEMWDTFCKKEDRIDNYEPYRYKAKESGIEQQVLSPNGLVLPFGDSPLDSDELGENVYIDILNQAKNYVYIFTPYLILSEKMIYAIQMAARRGVDVRIVMPGIPDKKIVFRLSRSYYEYLLKAGTRVYEYTPGFMHAKSFVSDDEVAVVGTINLDYRSLYLHFECATLLYRTNIIPEIKEDALQVIDESKEILPDRKRCFWNDMADAVLHLFAPLM